MDGELRTITISDNKYMGGAKKHVEHHKETVVEPARQSHSEPVNIPPSSPSPSTHSSHSSHSSHSVSAVPPGTVQSRPEEKEKDDLPYVDDTDSEISSVSSESSGEIESDSESIKSNSTIKTDELVQFSPQYHILKEFLKKKDSDENITDVLHSINKNLDSISSAMSQLNTTVADLTKIMKHKH